MEKRKILYVDKDPHTFRNIQNTLIHSKRQDLIVRSLRREYETLLVYNLHSPNLESEIRRFDPDCLLTHIPYDRESFNLSYYLSINKLTNLIEKNKNIIPVVYTGASSRSISDEQLRDMGLRGIIRKGDLGEEDMRKILDCLKRVFSGEDFVSYGGGNINIYNPLLS